MSFTPSPDRAAAGAVERIDLPGGIEWPPTSELLRQADMPDNAGLQIVAFPYPGRRTCVVGWEFSKSDEGSAKLSAMAEIVRRARQPIATTSRPVGGEAADLTEVERENAVLRAALSALPSIAEECRVKWDAGMKAGKLLIALTDPTLRYRADITELHRVAAMPTKREATLTADRDRLAREVERLAGLVEVSADLRALSDAATKGPWTTRLHGLARPDFAEIDGEGWFELASVTVQMEDELFRSVEGLANLKLIAVVVNRLRAQIAATAPPSDAAPAPAASTDGGAS